MYLSSLNLPHRHDPPPCHTYIYIDKNTDQCLTALTTISCLLSHLHGSLTCAFTMHHKQAVHDSQRLTDSLWHHSESRIPDTYNRVCTRLIRSHHKGVLGIQVMHVCEIYGWCFIDTCIWLRSSYISVMSLK